MNSKVVSNSVTCAVAVVQAHLPQCPAAQHLYVHACGGTKHRDAQIKHPAAGAETMMTSGETAPPRGETEKSVRVELLISF